MMAKKPKPAPSGAGSRTLSYILIGLLAVMIIYFLVLPAFAPPKTTSINTGPAPTSSLSLTPATDIAGTMVTITGQNLPKSSNVTAAFGSTGVQLTNGTGPLGYCRTSASGSVGGCNFCVPAPTPAGSYSVVLKFAGNANATALFTVPQ